MATELSKSMPNLVAYSKGITTDHHVSQELKINKNRLNQREAFTGMTEDLGLI